MKIISVFPMAFLALLGLHTCSPDASSFADQTPHKAHAEPAPFNPKYALIDQDGKPVTQQTYEGQYQLIYFGFTYCPDVCPIGLSLLTAAMRDLEESDASKITPIFITVDPERDPPETLKGYIASFHPRLQGLTANSPQTIRKVTNGFRAFAMKDMTDHKGHYDMTHTSLFYVIGPGGEALGTFSSTITKDEMLGKLQGFINAL